jgi:hypothetical protein
MRSWAAPAAVVVLALVVRAMGWGHGLPEFFDEAEPLRRALKMWRAGGAVDWNPHFFVYPSLTIYFHLAVQWIEIQVGSALGTYRSVADFLLAFETNPTAQAVVGRVAVTAVDLATVMGSYFLGERLVRGAGLAAAAFVAVAPTGIETSNALYVEAHLAAFTVWTLERMVTHQRRGDLGSLLTAGVLAGLAASSKYPGAILALPLCWAAASSPMAKSPSRVLVAALAAMGVAALAFALTSPFVLLDWASARNDLQFAADLAHGGHLGHLARASTDFYAALLARDPGIPVLLLFGAALAAVWPDRVLRCQIVTLALAVIPLLVIVSSSSVIAPRYVVSIAPLLATGAGVAAVTFLARLRAFALRWRAAVATAVVVASVLPAAWASLGRPARDTRSDALAWCSRLLPSGALVFCESGGPVLLGDDRKDAVQGSRVFLDASRRFQMQYLARRSFNSVSWPLFVHGDLEADVAPAGEPPVWRTVIPEAVDFNAVFYDRRLLTQADYIVTSSVVRSRYEADPLRYEPQVTAYRALERDATLASTFTPDRFRQGPEIRIYRIEPATRERWRETRPMLDPDWWLSAVPKDLRFTEASAEARADSAERAAALSDIFERNVSPTLERISRGLRRAGRPADADALDGLAAAWQSEGR